MQEISTEDAPASIGPYSQAIEANGFIFVSGQGAAEPETREVVSDNINEQAAQVFGNISAVLSAADASLNDVVKAIVFLTDMENYDAVNEVYAEYMGSPFPARSAVEVADLPIDIDVEIEVIAVAPDKE
jgi:2-iminobutanoate/2-iminopropanoate deaminase